MSKKPPESPWIELMRKGDFEKAWEFSDEVLKAGLNRDYFNLPRHYQCIWDGTPLNGKKVLIRCYHGLGDTIQFIRYAPLVKEIASEVIVWAQPRLLNLLSTVEGIDRLIPLHDGIPEVNYDVDVESMELPHIFRTTIHTIPSKFPYIHVEPQPLPVSKAELAIGLVWQAGDWDKSRSIPFSLFIPLSEVTGIRIFILQDKATEAGWQPDFGIHPGKCSLDDHARIIKSLDLLITVDSMPAHLAGALSTPVWVLLSKKADWRWLENRCDSPWYPSMKLFRQYIEDDWSEVVNLIIEEVKKLAVSYEL
jgi:hypothetical protein